jgi:hypothetical protein
LLIPVGTEDAAVRSCFQVDIAMLGIARAVTATIAAPVAALRLRRPMSSIKVKFTVARLPLPKISKEVRGKIDELTTYAGMPDWADIFFALSFLRCVDLVSIDIRNTWNRPSGNIEVFASDVRLWHLGEYRRATCDNMLMVGPIEPNSLTTIVAFIGVGGPYLDVLVRHDGREVGRI